MLSKSFLYIRYDKPLYPCYYAWKIALSHTKTGRPGGLIVYCFVLPVTSPGGHDSSSFFLFLFYVFFFFLFFFFYFFIFLFLYFFISFFFYFFIFFFFFFFLSVSFLCHCINLLCLLHYNVLSLSWFRDHRACISRRKNRHGHPSTGRKNVLV